MYWDVTSVQPEHHLTLTVKFSDGLQGTVHFVWKLDRLGRTVKGMIDLVNLLHQKGIHFKSLTDNVDTSTPSGRFFFHIFRRPTNQYHQRFCVTKY